jgi:uncharacterized protein (DUF1330 family)
MSDTPSFLVVSSILKPEKVGLLHEYMGRALPALMSTGGKPIGRYRAIEQLLGDDGPTLVAILEFPTSQAMRDALASDAFHAIDEMRDEIFERIDLMECATL